MTDISFLDAAWEAFMTRQAIVPGVNALVANSWQRCRLRLNPLQTVRLKRLQPEHLQMALTTYSSLLSIARPIMEDIYQYIEQSNTVNVLINGGGYILDMCGDQSMVDAARSLSIDVGTLAAESHMGTNAFGIPFFEGVPVRTIGPEHYLKQFHELAMAAAPIFSLSGRVIGILGVLTLVKDCHPHSLGLAVAGARAIEGQLGSISLLDEKNVQLTELNTILASLSEGIVVYDHMGTVTHINPMASRILQLPQSALVGRHILENLQFPPFFADAFQNRLPLRDEEINLTTPGQTINCIVSTRYIQKDHQPHWAIMTLREAEEFRQVVSRQTGAQMSLTLEDFTGVSPQMRPVTRMAKAAAGAKASILLRGEGGTGKNLLARAIHLEGPRRENPFIIFSCSSIPNEIVLNELLGFDEGLAPHTPGGRPSKFELGHTGTVYFQDVDQLPLEAQAALLTVIDLGIVMRRGSARPIPVDVRVIASTSANLEQLIAAGSFRADLYYRLSPFEIALPPLRKRSQDIPQLVRKIVDRLSTRTMHMAPGVLDLLQRYPWPGNVRELEASLERAITQARDSDTIDSLHFPPHIQQPGSGHVLPESPGRIQSIQAAEREAIIQAARRCKGNVTQMARLLGIGRTTVWRKLRALNITADQFR